MQVLSCVRLASAYRHSQCTYSFKLYLGSLDVIVRCSDRGFGVTVFLASVSPIVFPRQYSTHAYQLPRKIAK
jgi:hypothetical protein